MPISLNSNPNPYITNYNQGSSGAVNSGLLRHAGKTAGVVKDFSDPEVRASKRTGMVECETCKNRTYQDGSDDPGVSFKTPGHIDPGNSANAVMSHEQEHVRNESARASAENRKVVSQSVSLQTSVCPECGRSYISGGQTRTVTKSDTSQEKKDYFVENVKKLMTNSFGKSIDVKV